MSSKRAGRGHEVPSPAPPFPMIPRSLKHVISTLPTSQFTLGHYTGTKLNGSMSDDQYMRFKRDAGDYLSPFLTFFNKYPEVSQDFIEDLVHSRLAFSEKQNQAAEKLFHLMKASKLIVVRSMSAVKAEHEQVREQLAEARVSSPPELEAPARLDSKDEDELTILPVFENDSHLSQLVNFACEVYKAIQRIFLHYLRLTFNDFSNATFRDGVAQHIQRNKMEDNPMEAFNLLTSLKFSSGHGHIVQNFAALTALTLTGFRQLFNDFSGPAEQLSILDPSLSYNVTVVFLMHAMEKGWSSKHGPPSDKDAAIAKLNGMRSSPQLSLDTLNTFFVQLSGVHREDILPGKPEQNGDFVGAVTGRGARGRGARSGVPRYNKLPLVEASEQPAQSPLKASASQAGRGQPAQVQQDQPDQREVCKKYFKGKCDTKCGRRHVFPCTFHYVSGSKKCTNADKCKFSHEFTAPGLARHNELHPDHKKNYDLLKGQQIMEPISASIDCKVCNGTHAPGNCKQKQRHDRASSRSRDPFSGHVDAEVQRSALRDVNRYDEIRRTIENELAGAKLPQ